MTAFLPLAFALRRSALYRLGFVGAGSLAVAGVAAIWLAERSLGVTLL